MFYFLKPKNPPPSSGHVSRASIMNPLFHTFPSLLQEKEGYKKIDILWWMC